MKENQVDKRVTHAMSEARKRMGGTPTNYGEIEILRSGLGELCNIVQDIINRLPPGKDDNPDYMHDPLACTPDEEMS
jgi:hypothetical protein